VSEIEVNSFKNLKRKQKSAFFLGCSPSINSLTLEQEQKIQDNFDVWVSNNFMVHKRIIPDFYHVEIKHHRNGPLIHRLAHERKDKYQNVNWIIDQTRTYILNYVSHKDYPHKNFHLYPKTYRKSNDGLYNPLDNKVSVSCNASITVIMDIMTRMGYEKIYFLGVDMNDSRYFWSGNKEYGDIEMEDIVKSCKPDERSIDDPHPTMHMKDYLPEYLEYNGQDAINLSEASLLSKKMITMDINEVLNEL